MITISGIEVMPGTGIVPSLYDIGWGLARTGRFASQTKTWYSVLPHVYAVASLVSDKARPYALLHDAAESVVGDQVATWKNDLTKESENEILSAIYADMNLSEPSQEILDEVLCADLVCRAAEAELLGHAEANHPHFQDIRDKYPELYIRAIDATKNRIAIYTPITCIGDTHRRAKEYEDSVQRSIEEVLVA